MSTLIEIDPAVGALPDEEKYRFSASLPCADTALPRLCLWVIRTNRVLIRMSPLPL